MIVQFHRLIVDRTNCNSLSPRKIKGRKQLFFKWVWKLVNSPNQNMFTLSHWSQTNIQLCQTCNYYRKSYIFTITKFCVGLNILSILFQNNDNFLSLVHNNKICGFRPWAWISLILCDCCCEVSSFFSPLPVLGHLHWKV